MKSIHHVLIAATMAAVLTITCAGQNQPQVSTTDVDSVRKVLEDQVKAWNRGDLEGYMQGYWKSPDLTFYGGTRIAQGWQEAMDRYIKGYKSAGKEMGQLEFSGMSIDLLASDVAFVRGQFHLKMSDGKEPHGLFTLLMRKMPEGWKIVHDHSSGE